MAKLIPGFVGLGGTAKRVKNTLTGEILSRREYSKLLHPGKTNEQYALENLKSDPFKSLIRPTKGRKSSLSLPTQKQLKEVNKLIKSRELERQKRESELLKKQVDKYKNKIKNKKPPKNIKQLLKPGNMARRIPYEHYSELLTILKRAEKSGVVFGYFWGMQGVDSRDPRHILTPTLSGGLQRGPDDPPDETEYYEIIKLFVETHSYFIYVNMWLQLTYTGKYARDLRDKHGIKPKKYY